MKYFAHHLELLQNIHINIEHKSIKIDENSKWIWLTICHLIDSFDFICVGNILYFPCTSSVCTKVVCIAYTKYSDYIHGTDTNINEF